MTDAAHASPRCAPSCATTRAFVATPAPRLSWTVETDAAGWRQASAELRSRPGVRRASRAGDSVLVDWPFTPLAAGETREVQVRATAERGAADRLERTAHDRRGLPRRRRLGRRADRPRRPDARGAAVPRAHDVHRRRRRCGARRCTGRRSVSPSPSSTAPRSRTTCSRPGGRATATASCTRPSTSPRSCSPARTCSARRSPAPGTPRSTASSSSPTASTATSRRSSAQLRLEFEDGTVHDDRDRRRRMARRRRTARSSASGIYAGEHQDLRLADAGLVGARRTTTPTGRPCASAPPPAPDYENVPVPEARIAPARAPHRRRCRWPRCSPRPPARLVLDFGQNLVGRLRLRVTGPAGDAHHRAARRGAARTASSPCGRCGTRQPTAYFDLAATASRRWSRGSRSTASGTPQIDGWPGEFDPAAVEAVVAAHRHDAHRLVRVLARAAEPPARERRLGHARQLPRRSRPTARSATSASGGRATSRSSARPPASSTTATGSSPRGCATSRSSRRAATATSRSSCPAALPALRRPGRRGRVGRCRDGRRRGCCTSGSATPACCAAQYDSMRDWVDAVLRVGDRRTVGGHVPARRLARPGGAARQARPRPRSTATSSRRAYLARSLRIVADTAALLGHDDGCRRRTRALAERAAPRSSPST